MTILQVYEWFYDQYGLPTEEVTIKNTAKVLDNSSSHEGMEKLIDRFDKGVTYASFASQEIACHTTVTHFLTVIKKTGKH